MTDKPITVSALIAAIETRRDNGFREADKRFSLFDLSAADLDAIAEQIKAEGCGMTLEEWEELYGEEDDDE